MATKKRSKSLAAKGKVRGAAKKPAARTAAAGKGAARKTATAKPAARKKSSKASAKRKKGRAAAKAGSQRPANPAVRYFAKTFDYLL